MTRIAPSRGGLWTVVVGGANLDIKARSAGPVVAGSSNPGSVVMCPGGVGRNVAENLARLGADVKLVSAVGSDEPGRLVLTATAAAGVDVDLVRRLDGATDTYTAVTQPDGELVAAVSDMAAVATVTADVVEAARQAITSARLVVLDANLAPETATRALDIADEAGVPVVLDPVSVPKSRALAAILGRRPLLAVTPNRDELAALTGLPTRTDHDVRVAAAALHARDVETVWVRLGRDGSLLSDSSGVTELAAVPAAVVDVTGAGDAMLAAFCWALLGGSTATDAAAYGHAAAALTLASPHTVRPDLTQDLLRSVPA